MVSYCGIVCTRCPAYRFPRIGERLGLAGLAQAVLKRGMKDKPEGYVICDGCTAIDARCVKHCLACPVRCCAMETGVENCAHCARFPCERLQGIWKVTVFKDAKRRLTKLHAELASKGSD